MAWFAQISWTQFYQKLVREYNYDVGSLSLCDSIVMKYPVWFNRYFSDQDIADKCEGLCDLGYVDCTVACSNTNCLLECGRALSDCLEGNWKVTEQGFEKSFLRLSMPCKLSKWLFRLSKSDMRLWREFYASKWTQFGSMQKGKKHWFGIVHYCMQQWSSMREFMYWNLQNAIRRLSLSGKSLTVRLSIFFHNNHAFLRTIALLDARVILSTANRTKNLSWYWILFPAIDQFSSNMTVGNFSIKRDRIVMNESKNISGGINENFDFTMGPNTSAEVSCSAKLNGEMFVFGGNSDETTKTQKTQVRRDDKNRLTKNISDK